MVEFEWGAEIPVDRKRPEGLKDSDPCLFQDARGRWYGKSVDWTIGNHTNFWEQDVRCLRLLADHPYYSNRAEPANDELAELRAFKEAAIARFPELAPVDPDLLEAREICAKNVDSHNPLMIEPYRNGEYDNHWLMRCVREGIERGRELERYAQGLTTPND